MASLPESIEQTIAGQTLELPPRKTDDTYFGPYMLLRKLGAGGMGEVYLAEDVRLGRKIALKMLPEKYTQNADRVRRFVREAKAASALNHPNIITIFDIGESNDKHYTVTEYIEGRTLRHRMAAPATIAEALDFGIQIASALKAAHEAGIIHRDIKPENIMLRPDGLVKILDFGIAKLVERESLAASAFDPYLTTPEMKSEGTAPGLILGTVTYMSPEQLRGQEVDGRSDIFSLGIVLYEVLTGTPPFIGQTQADRIAAILEHEPKPLADHRPDVPPRLEHITSKALRKDREVRYQSAGDMIVDLTLLEEELKFREKLERSTQDELRNRQEISRTLLRRWRRLPAAVIIITALIVILTALIFVRL